MTEQAHAAAVGSTQRTDLFELSVVLVVTSNNPSIINPDFLVHNDIIDKSRPLQENAIATPVFSQVTYEGGLTVRADPERVVFVQSVPGIPWADSACPKMAERYARAVSHVPYRAVGINPKLYIDSGDADSARVSNVLDERGSWLSFKDSDPEIQLKAIYPFGSRKISMDVLGAARPLPNGQQTQGLLFQANVHRDLEQISSQARIDTLISIVREWESDVLDCRALAEKFTPHAFRDLT